MYAHHLPFYQKFFLVLLHSKICLKSSIAMAHLTPARPTEATSASLEHLPFELLRMIIDYATEGLRTALLPTTQLPAVAQVSQLFRALYLQYESENDFGIGARAMPMGSKRHCDVVYSKRHFRPQIRETLSFPDLETMAAYFTSGPGRPEWGYCLAHVKFVRIVYRDSAKSFWRYTLEYAYEAFELLYANLRRMPLLQRLQVVADDFPNGMSVETPGMWSLLKVRGLQAVILTGYAWPRNKRLANAVRNRLKWKPSSRWRPLGFENPGTRHWPWIQQLDFQEQWQWLDKRYQDLQDRAIVTKRRLRRRKAYNARYGTTQVGRARRRFVVIWKKRR
jgi:hypothetical protein